ncbi:MAG: endoglucanase [Myxococcaceae bacterium]|nr:endoglucanase [Myxococcaceae bacterium]
MSKRRCVLRASHHAWASDVLIFRDALKRARSAALAVAQTTGEVVTRLITEIAHASLFAGLTVGAVAATGLSAAPARAQTTDTYTFCANEWSTCPFTGTRTVRYGDEGHYVYKSFSGGVACRNDAFGGDPHPSSLSKTCALQTTSSTAVPAPAPAPIDTSAKTYTTCANEWGTCAFSGTKVVRYGDLGHYVTKVFSNGAACRNDSFGGDPHPGSLTKTCALESGSVSTTPAPTPTLMSVSVPVPVPTPVPAAPVPASPAPTGSATRPSYNRGVGFFVLAGKLYDANGKEFRPRGVNKVHWDNPSLGLNNTKANATRWTIDFNQSTAKNLALLQGTSGNAGTIARQNVIIPGNWNGTCKDDPSYLNAIVDTWVAQVSMWKTLEKQMILNIANEWGPGDSTVWRDSYINAIARLRAAGYHATISITAGGCGQDPNSILKWGQAVFNSDPEKNVIFDQHVYGAYQDVAGGAPGQWDDQPDLETHFKALNATGLVVMIGEFGPGRGIGPSPTNIKPERVMQLAEQYGLGWLAWAWDDNNLAQSRSDDTWFGMSVSGSYNSSSDLTIFGRTVVEHPSLGLKVLGKPASIFQ